MDPTDSPYCLFTGSLTQEEGHYVLEVPDQEVELGTLSTDETYRIGVFPGPDGQGNAQESPAAAAAATAPQDAPDRQPAGQGGDVPTPPVSEGERRTVTIESLGEQGDGIAKVERGFVIIVPGAGVGEEVVVEIDSVKQNLAFASIVESAR